MQIANHKMKTCLKSLLWITILAGLMLAVYGCVTTIDPATGQKVYQIDPNWAGLFDKSAAVVAAAAPAATVAASIFFPGAVPLITLIVGVVGGLIGMWTNLKPKVTQAQTLAGQTKNVLTSAVTAIENYKTNNPDGWKVLSAELEKLIPKGSAADDIIRIIRGLLPIAN